MTCQGMAKQFYILLITRQTNIFDRDQRYLLIRGDKGGDCYVFATRKCGLYRREAFCKASGEMALFGYADLPT